MSVFSSNIFHIYDTELRFMQQVKDMHTGY